VKLAIRESIQRHVEQLRIREEAERNGLAMDDEEDEEPVPEILPRHFEEAVRNARRSVSDRDLAQYSSFAQTMHQSRSQMTSGGGSLATFQFPGQRGGGMNEGMMGGEMKDMDDDDDDDDLYS
jgi:transitional endoplasmic reticulum ATPase